MAPVCAAWPARGYFWRLCCLVSPFHAISRETQKILGTLLKMSPLGYFAMPSLSFRKEIY